MAEFFSDILNKRYSRRKFALKVSGLAAATALTSGFSFGEWFGIKKEENTTLNFTEIEHIIEDNIRLSPGYEAKVLLRWGDKILNDSPAFLPLSQNIAAQEKQFGFNNDFIAYMPLPLGSDNSGRGLLCVNHEYPIPSLMFADFKEQKLTKKDCEIQLAALGMSIIEIRKTISGWQVNTEGKYNRRISGLSTACKVSGPAKDSPRLGTSYDPKNKGLIGTIANCGGGKTPWGTILTAEENFDQYFSGVPSNLLELPNYARYFSRKEKRGKKKSGFGKFIPRFNLQKEPAEQNRFGWLVEIDPYDPNSVPVKRTALGRFKHESAAITLCSDGRVAVYSGDDQEFEYIYKFISKNKYDASNREANLNLLDEGTLYVAKFKDSGECQWLPLRHGEGPLTERNYFTGQGDVMIETRLAADLLAPTKMDRPEGIAISPSSGSVFISLTGNDLRKIKQANKANPVAPNKHGHIIELIPPVKEGKADHSAETCRWDLFLVGGKPGSDKNASYNKRTSANGYLSKPDNLAFDPKGRLWIATDGQPKTIKSCDGIFATEVRGEGRALTKHFMNVPRGAEATGQEFTPDGRTLFLSVQHPGESEGTFEKPSTRWPDFDAKMPPRPSVIAITRKGNKIIGG